MSHYEIVIMIHPDQNSDQVMKIIKNYKSFIVTNNGLIYRLEDWGRRQLAYSIQKLHKAYYILMNIKLSNNIMIDLKKKFRFDQYIIRSFVMKLKNKVDKISPIMKIQNEKKISK